MVVEQQAVIKESHIYILYSLDTTYSQHILNCHRQTVHTLAGCGGGGSGCCGGGGWAVVEAETVFTFLLDFSTRLTIESTKSCSRCYVTLPPHAAYWDAHYIYYMLKLLLYWFTDSQQLYNSTYKNFTHTNRKINKLQRHWLINMLKIIVILVDERVVMYRRSGEARFALNDYFLLPLPESLELVLDPLPELELSPSLELSELLLSLRRDTCPSNPTITQHSILNNFKCWILRTTCFLYLLHKISKTRWTIFIEQILWNYMNILTKKNKSQTTCNLWHYIYFKFSQST